MRQQFRLQIRDLSKTYPNGVRALRGIDLDIDSGMFGLLGPNGAGKSTLMRTLATLQQPDRGSVRFDDIDVLREPDRLRAVLGYLPQEFGLYPNLTAEAILDHFAVLKGIADGRQRRAQVAALLEQVNLQDARKNAVGGFSGGMKQRLGIAIALLGRPQLVIVDEPTAGLDPTERHRFLNLLADIGESVVVILSTHIAEDVRELCERFAIIASGAVRFTGAPAAAVDALRGKLWRRVVDQPDLEDIQRRLRVLSTRMVARRPVVHVYHDGPPDPAFAPIEPDLEDVYFFHITAAAQAAAAEAA